MTGDESNYTGLTFSDYNTLLDNSTAKTKEVFGNDAKADDTNSTLGMLNKLLSFFFNQLYQKEQDVYYSRFLDLMEGPDLDRYGANHAIPRLAATNAQVTLQFTGTAGTQINSGTFYSDENDNEFELTNAVTIGSDGTGTGLAESSVATDQANVAANTITTILELTNGLDSVTNPQQALGGAEEEDDTDYRARLHLGDNSKDGPTNNGLYTAMYAIEGVKLVKILEESSNAKNIPDSLHFYVQGGRTEDIANTIMKNIAWGIPTVGSISQNVIDDGGNQHVIKFDEATVVPIYVSIEYTITPEFDTANGDSDLKESLGNYIEGLDMGSVIDFNRFYQIAYNIEGIKTANIKIGTTANNLNQSSIQLTEFESANLANVEVVQDE